jgi:hypothetical protein
MAATPKLRMHFQVVLMYFSREIRGPLVDSRRTAATVDASGTRVGQYQRGRTTRQSTRRYSGYIDGYIAHL